MLPPPPPPTYHARSPSFVTKLSLLLPPSAAPTSMAIATALAGSSVASRPTLQSRQFLGSGLHGLQPSRHPPPKVPSSFPPSISSKLCVPSLSPHQVAVGGGALAGAVFAALASFESALAAQQVMELAADDNRGIALLIPVVPAVAWVLYNILQPALNQLDRMKSAKALAAGVGLGTLATLLVPPHASAAQEIARIADSDSRGLVLLGVLIPAVGWVLYNILQPGLNQLSRMRSSKGFIGAVSLGAASMLCSPQADAAVQELASIADDSRGVLLLGVLIPAVGWVLFNILQPALNQLNKMKATKGLVGAAGLGATVASLMYVPNADAVQDVSQLAADADNRPLILLFVLIPAVGWVLYNILQPALNQLDKMKAGK